MVAIVIGVSGIGIEGRIGWDGMGWDGMRWDEMSELD